MAGFGRKRTRSSSSAWFDLPRPDAPGDGASTDENRTGYKGKRARRELSAQFGRAGYRLRLTPWGCQLNVGLNSEKFTPCETNAPHVVVRESHVGSRTDLREVP